MSGDFEVPDFMPKKVEDILHKILNTDPKKRYTIQEIREHEWFKENIGDENPNKNSSMKQLSQIGVSPGLPKPTATSQVNQI